MEHPREMPDNQMHRDDVRFGLATMKWYGWGSPVGFGLFLLAIGGLLELLHLAGIIG